MDYYPYVRSFHLSLISISLLLFLLRFLGKHLLHRWVQHASLKVLPHMIDTLLLGTGIGLCLLIDQYPGMEPWLTVKIILLVMYIGLGMKAMKHAGQPVAVKYLTAALICVALLISVALSRHPLGVLSWL